MGAAGWGNLGGRAGAAGAESRCEEERKRRDRATTHDEAPSAWSPGDRDAHVRKGRSRKGARGKRAPQRGVKAEANPAQARHIAPESPLMLDDCARQACRSIFWQRWQLLYLIPARFTSEIRAALLARNPFAIMLRPLFQAAVATGVLSASLIMAPPVQAFPAPPA